MRIVLKSHGLKLDKNIKSYAEEKILKLKKWVIEPAVAEINFSVRTHRGKNKIIKIVLSLPNHKKAMHAENCCDDFYTAVDLTTDRLKTQLSKTKGKLKNSSSLIVKDWTERLVQIGMAGPKWLIRKTKRK